MAHAVYIGVQTASMVSTLSNKFMLSSVELAVHAAAAALKTLRPSAQEQSANAPPAITDNPHVREELEQMDIEAKIKTVHALVLTIQKQRGGGQNGSTVDVDQVPQQQPAPEEDPSDVVGVCLVQVKDVLDSITSTLQALNEELEAHDARWFSSWRQPDCRAMLIALKAKMLILDKRVDMLLKVRSFVNPPAATSSNEEQHYQHQLQRQHYPIKYSGNNGIVMKM